ncbi:hypothetical protein L345_05815, partial [Ophiophagus hannah]
MTNLKVHWLLLPVNEVTELTGVAGRGPNRILTEVKADQSEQYGLELSGTRGQHRTGLLGGACCKEPPPLPFIHSERDSFHGSASQFCQSLITVRRTVIGLCARFNRAAHLSLAGYLATPPRHLSPNSEGSVVSPFVGNYWLWQASILLLVLILPLTLLDYFLAILEATGTWPTADWMWVGNKLGCATGIFTRRLSTLLREVLSVSRRACLPGSELVWEGRPGHVLHRAANGSVGLEVCPSALDLREWRNEEDKATS